MNVAEAIEVLRGLTYKPGWTLQFYSVPGALVMRAGTREPDVRAVLRGEHLVIDVVLTETLAEDRLQAGGRDELLEWVFGVLRNRELHEVEEWLRLGGQPVYSPHPGRSVGLLGNGASTPT